MPKPIDNPYVGPRTFTRTEADLFFGREREARQLLSRVISERLVLFYAQSGAGKSSLIHTRLIPQLEAADFTVLPVGRVSGELPADVGAVDNIYAFNLMLSLDQGEGDPNRLAHLPLPDFLARLTINPDEHWYYDDAATLETLGDNTADGAPYVLIIDQFEEIITAHVEHWSERADFFHQLDQAMAADPLLWVVLTLREDYVAALEPYAPLLSDRLRVRFYMQRMGVDAALEAITKPAELGSRPFAPGVAETLVDNLRQVHIPGQAAPRPGQYVEPVQLQVVCYKLWDGLKAQPPGPITAADLQAAGDVDSALAEFYEQALQVVITQTQAPEITLRRWFDQQLITEAGTRGTVYQGDRQTAGLPNRAVELLANQYLLRAEIRSGGIWYELIHDRLVEPIVKANRAWYERRLARNPLAKARQLWLESGRLPDKLLRGTPLKEARAYAEANPEDTTAEEQNFLEESSRRLNPLATAAQIWLEGERNPDLLLRGRQLGEARSYAAENPADLSSEEQEFLTTSERQAQFEQTQAALAARRRRYAVIAASVTIIVLAALLGWALQNAVEARQQQAIAEFNQQKAQAAGNIALAQKSAAETAQAAAFTSEAVAQTNAAVALTAQAETEVEADKARAAEATAVAERDNAKTAEAQARGLADSLAALVPTETPTALPTSTPAAPQPTPTPSPPLPNVGPTPNPVPTNPATPTPTATPTASATALPTPNQTATIQVAQTRLAEVRASDTAAAQPVSPFGRLVFTSNRFSDDKKVGHLFTMNADGSDQRQLTRDFATEPNYSATLDKIVFSKPQFHGIIVLFTIRPNGAEEQGIDEQFWDNWEPAFAWDGRRIAFTSSRENRDWEIYTRNLDGSDLRWNDCGPTVPVGFSELLKSAPAWSPDGQKIAFMVSTEHDHYSGQAGIWLMDADGTNCQPLTGTAGVIDKYPDWSPDGRQIVFASNRNGTFELFVMDADGRNQRQVPTPATFPQHINYPAWSPDGNWFTFSASTTPGDITPDDIFVMTVDGRHLANLTNGTPGQNENWYSDWID
jgi:Tol biopolymer transport system component